MAPRVRPQLQGEMKRLQVAPRRDRARRRGERMARQASVHDGQTVISLAPMTQGRVTHRHDLTDAVIAARRGVAAAAVRTLYRSSITIGVDLKKLRLTRRKSSATRSAVKHSPRGRGLWGIRWQQIWVRDPVKVMSHLVLGIGRSVARCRLADALTDIG